MSNFSLMNNGTSLNFDGEELQNQQEDEYRQEEEQQQHELRQLLTDAFDDLIDEDDILSVMSDDEENSRNESLSRSHDDRESSAEQQEACRANVDWGMQTYPGASITPSNTDSGLVSPQYSSRNSLAQSWDFHQHAVHPQAAAAHLAFQQEQVRQEPETQMWSADHHHAQINIYPQEQPIPEMADRRFIQREEAEGENVDRHVYNVGNNPYWMHHGNDGYYSNDYLEEEQPRVGLFNAPKHDVPAYPVFFTNYESSVSTHDINPVANVSYSMMEQTYANSPVYTIAQQHEEAPQAALPQKQEKDYSSSPRKQEFVHLTSPCKLEYNQDYKVQYRKCLKAQLDDEKSMDVIPEKIMPTGPTELEEFPETDFVHHGGSVENRELAQLQILYKARGRKLEEITSEYETVKDDTAREIRILKHQLNLSKGEKEGSASSLKECQGLLLEEKSSTAQLSGKLQAMESHSESLKKGKDEVIKKLQITESAIETLNSQLAEMNTSETLSRARHEHEIVVGSLQQRYEKEINVIKEKIDHLNSLLLEKNDELASVKKQLTSSMKAYENDQISRADTINRLTRSLDESQKQCQSLLDSSSTHELSQLKAQMHQAFASKSITDEMCVSLQSENKDLKEQLNMLESASLLGAVNQRSGAVSEGHDDSIADLGIKKTLNFMTPEMSHTTTESSSSSNIVSGLRVELERCLFSNRQKREEIMTIKQELITSKKEVISLTARCERAEFTLKENQAKLKEFENLMKPGEKNQVEVRLRKDLENLKREKDIIFEDANDLKKRLEEVAASEQRLMEINFELNQQISAMIKEHDDDKRTSLDRCKKTYEQVFEDAKDKLRIELTSTFDEEKEALISKYQTEQKKTQIELNTALRQVDEVKELYVQVCEQKERLRDEMKIDIDKEMKEKINEIKEELEREKEEEKDHETFNEQAVTVKIREQVRKELEDDRKQSIETKVAMAKVEWFEEQRAAKHAAVENALKLSEVEWKSKMEATVQEEIGKRVDEAKEEWFAEQTESVRVEVEQQMQEQMVKMATETEVNFEKRLRNEQVVWDKNMESKIIEAVKKEKEIWQSKMVKLSNKLKDQLTSEKQIFEVDLENRIKQKLEKEKEIWEVQHNDEIQKERVSADNLQEMLQHEKNRFDDQLEIEIQKRLEANKEMFEERLDAEIKRCLEGEKDKIDEKVEYEINLRLGLEKIKIEENVKNNMKHDFEQEKIELVNRLEYDIQERLCLEKTQLTKQFEMGLIKEKQMLALQANSEKAVAIEWVRSECMKMHESEIGQLQLTRQLETNKKVDDAVNDKMVEWQREHEMTQSILQAELESVKLECDALQKEKQSKEMAFLREKEELTRQKDEERKQTVADIQDQCEQEYKQLMEDHHETLTHALKASREQHTREKSELQQRHEEEMLSLKRREERLIQQIQDTAMHAVDEEHLHLLDSLKKENADLLLEKEQLMNTVSEKDKLLDKDKQEWLADRENIFWRITERDEALQKAKMALATEKENWKCEKEFFSSDISEKDELLEAAKIEFAKNKDLWESEKQMLLNDVSERDVLLEKADEHIVQEVEKLRIELQSTYQSRLEAESEKIQQKAELDMINAHTVDEKERADAQMKRHAVEDELQKVKNQLFVESETYVAEIHELSEEVSTKSQHLAELEQQMAILGDKKEIYLENVKELKTLKSEKNDLISKLELMHKAIEKLKSEKMLLIGKIKKMESKYNSDITDMKQKQEELNSRLQKTEKVLKDSKQLYRLEIEKLRKSLEAENGATVEKLKNKMIEMHKGHLSTLESMKHQYKSDKQEFCVKYQQQKCDNSSSKLIQTEISDLESDGILNMRSEYLCTVGKIKDDVLRHVTETNLRAAETVKTEVLKERQITWLQLKKIKENVRRILQNEIIGANLETKLSEVERALDAISSSNPSSRSTTPRSELSNMSRTPTPSRMLGTLSPSKLYQGPQNNERSRSVTPTSQTNYVPRSHSVTPTSQLYYTPEPRALEKALATLEKSSDNGEYRNVVDPFSFDKDPVWPDEDQKQTKDIKCHVPISEKREIYPHRRTMSEKRVIMNTPYHNKTSHEKKSLEHEKLFAKCLDYKNCQNEYKHSSVHKTVSEPDLSVDNSSYSPCMEQHDDTIIGSYRYTSLRDTLKRPTSTSPRKVLNQNSADLPRRTNVAIARYRGERFKSCTPTELTSQLSKHLDDCKDTPVNMSSSTQKHSGTVESKPKDVQRVLRSVHKSEPFIRQTVVSQGRQPLRSTGQRYQGMPAPEPAKDTTFNPPHVDHTAKYSPPLIRFSRKKLTSLSQ